MGKAAIIYHTGLMVQVVKAGMIYHTGFMLQIGPKYLPEFFSKGCDTGPPHNIETTSLYYLSYVEVSVQSLISPLFEFYKPYFSIHIQTLVGQNVNIKNIEFLLRLICTFITSRDRVLENFHPLGYFLTSCPLKKVDFQRPDLQLL